ncbi:Hypp3505 [Branchiostoma lanceolatum]|uniref:Hypp3505 protein n=1 Tax=Branchiostoma lanceolatum TaxID=7740 RepID=A0A8K0A170_BRALA|nr:Hypp3505 [Branchiostoma lanceolatum]
MTLKGGYNTRRRQNLDEDDYDDIAVRGAGFHLSFSGFAQRLGGNAAGSLGLFFGTGSEPMVLENADRERLVDHYSMLQIPNPQQEVSQPRLGTPAAPAATGSTQPAPGTSGSGTAHVQPADGGRQLTAGGSQPGQPAQTQPRAGDQTQAPAMDPQANAMEDLRKGDAGHERDIGPSPAGQDCRRPQRRAAPGAGEVGGRGGGGSGAQPWDECYRCHNIGHWARDCKAARK